MRPGPGSWSWSRPDDDDDDDDDYDDDDDDDDDEDDWIRNKKYLLISNRKYFSLKTSIGKDAEIVAAG